MKCSRLLIYITAVLCITGAVIMLERSWQPSLSPEMIETAHHYGAERQLPTPPQPFHFDGCTLFPDRVFQTDFSSACLQHDIAYWYGGSDYTRQIADERFRVDIAQSGRAGALLQWPIYSAVRIFGDTWLLQIFNANWGFGYNE